MNANGMVNIGNALILSKEEFEDYFEKKLKNSATGKEEQEKAMEDIRKGRRKKIEDYYFDTDYKSKNFDFIKYLANDEYNLYYVPLHGAGSSLIPSPINDTSYLVFADWSNFTDSSFRRCPYNRYQDIVDEFKLKVSVFLPKDFQWDSHIGTILYESKKED